MLKKLRKESFKGTIFLSVMFVVIAAIMIVFASNNLFQFLFMNQSLNYGKFNYQEDSYANYTANAVVDVYGEGSGMTFYIIPVYEDQYMGLCASSWQKGEYDALCDATYAYLLGETEQINYPSISSKGYVYQMDSTGLSYFKQWFEETGFLGEGNIDDYIIPYIYKPERTSMMIESSDYFLFGTGVLLFLLAIMFFVLTITGFYQRKIVKRVMENGWDYDRIAESFDNSLKMGRIYFGSEYTVVQIGMSHQIMENREIVWAFKHVLTTQHRTYGIPTGKSYTYTLKFFAEDGNHYDVVMKNEKQVDETLEYIRSRMSGVIVGHNENIAGLYVNNRAEFVRMAREQTQTDTMQNY